MYKKLTIYQLDNEENFNREIIVENDISLIDLRLILMATLGTCFCHLSEFVDQNTVYAEKTSFDEVSDNDKLMSDFSLKDLSESFMFSYDFGDCWDFQVDVADAANIKEIKGAVKIISGFGEGIWEDNKEGHYLASKLGPAKRKKIDANTECDFSGPWNLEYENIDDLFQPIDVKANQLRTLFMLDIFEDVYIEEIMTSKYFNDRYKRKEIWKFTEHGLSTDKKISILQNYDSRLDAEEYENLCKLIRKNNEFYLDQFHEWVLSKGIKRTTADKHCENIIFYISLYLCRNFIQPCKYGAHYSNLEEFFCRFLISDSVFSSVSTIKASCVSIKKFYTFMAEFGYISKTELKQCVDTIKDNKSEWITLFKEADKF